MIEYIYIIQNTENGKFYVGRTNDPQARKRGHLSELRRGIHGNPKLQNAFNKYGIDSFTFSVVDCCSSELIRDREQEWFDKFNRDTSLLYNCHFETYGGPICTGPMAEETKAKISEAIKNNTRNYIFDILDERYNNQTSLKVLAQKYGVGINTIIDYIPEWESKTGLSMISHTQIEHTIARVGAFIEDYDNGLVNISDFKKYNTTKKSIEKYCHIFGRSFDEFEGSTTKLLARQKAVDAVKYMQETGCSASKAIRDCGTSVTTFYKYLNTIKPII